MLVEECPRHYSGLRPTIYTGFDMNFTTIIAKYGDGLTAGLTSMSDVIRLTAAFY